MVYQTNHNSSVHFMAVVEHVCLIFIQCPCIIRSE